MAVDSDVVRRAYLKVTGSRGLLGSLTRIGTKKNWVVLKKDSHSARSRVEVYKDEDDVTKRHPTKVIGIDQISRINTSPEKKELTLILGDENIMFLCSSRADMDDWVRDIDGLRKHGSIKFGRRISSENGMLPAPEDDVFRVRLRQSSSLLFHGPCLLEIQQDFDRNLFHIAIFTEDDPPRLVVKWQIDHIRQYGSNDVAFKFQSGSKSPTGVDWFILDTETGCAPKVHQAVDYWARHIVEQTNNIPLPVPRIRSRSKTNSSSSPVPSPQSPPPLPTNAAAYTPLLHDRQPPSIYEDLNNRDNRFHHSLSPQLSTQLSSSVPTTTNAIYQPLLPGTNSLVTSTNDTYAGLNDATRERIRSVSVTTNSSATITNQNSEYMGLSSATRNNPDSMYMGVNHPR